MTRLWVVRAGKSGEREQEALYEGVLAPGFLEVPSLEDAHMKDIG